MSWSGNQWSARSGIFNDHEPTTNTIQFLENLLDNQAGDGGSRRPLLGLKLTKSQSLLKFLQAKVKTNDDSPAPENPRIGRDDSDRLKASNFPATFIRIGAWQRTTRNEGDLMAKLYYAKRKLVWEMLDGALKSKIEIQWSDIIGIRALTNDKETGILEIELHQPPAFFREINPQPRKHTLWEQASDFTGGQALTHRRHCVGFKPGVLDRHYKKLLLFDPRLLDLSQKPFPINESPSFNPPETMLASDIPGSSSSSYYHLTPYFNPPETMLKSDIPGSSSYYDLRMQQRDPAVREVPYQTQTTWENTPYQTQTTWENTGNQGSFNAASAMNPYQYQNYIENQGPQVNNGTYINDNTASASAGFRRTPRGQDRVYKVTINRTAFQQSNNAVVPPNNSMHPFQFPESSIDGKSFYK